jgi:hypothetical protein
LRLNALLSLIRRESRRRLTVRRGRPRFWRPRPYSRRTKCAAMSTFAQGLRLFWFQTRTVSGVRRQPACKPGSVWRTVSRAMAIPLGRPLPTASSNQPGQRSGDGSKDSSAEKLLASPLFGLAPGGACHAAHVAMRVVRSYRTVSPLPRGGFFSVALSLGLPPPDVIRHRVSVEPGLSSAVRAAAIRPAGGNHIGALGHFVNYRIGNAHAAQMPRADSFRARKVDFRLDPTLRLGCLNGLGIGAGC